MWIFSILGFLGFFFAFMLRRAETGPDAHGLETVAVPAIGAGVAGLPMRRCAEILLEEASAHLRGETTVREVRFVLFGEPAFRLFYSVDDARKIAEQVGRMGAD